VINLDDMAVETPQKVLERAKRALEHLKPEDMILAPDCGMKYLPREVAFGKMQALVEGAKLLRKEYR
jgi:5-methyltetrahydropteroyltriglutamate--homocysteine methyltransferase